MEQRRLLEEYRRQKALKLEGNLYHKTQVELAYNSNRIEGSRLSVDQTRQIFETRTVSGDARIEDITETENHFRLFDSMLDTADDALSLDLIRSFHSALKANTAQAASDPAFTPGVFKTFPNEVGGGACSPRIRLTLKSGSAIWFTCSTSVALRSSPSWISR